MGMLCFECVLRTAAERTIGLSKEHCAALIAAVVTGELELKQ